MLKNTNQNNTKKNHSVIFEDEYYQGLSKNGAKKMIKNIISNCAKDGYEAWEEETKYFEEDKSPTS